VTNAQGTVTYSVYELTVPVQHNCVSTLLVGYHGGYLSSRKPRSSDLQRLSCYHKCLKFFLVLNDVTMLPWFYSTWDWQVLIPLYITVQLSGYKAGVTVLPTVNEIVSYFNDILPITVKLDNW